MAGKNNELDDLGLTTKERAELDDALVDIADIEGKEPVTAEEFLSNSEKSAETTANRDTVLERMVESGEALEVTSENSEPNKLGGSTRTR